MAVKSGRLEPLKLFKVFRSLLERRMSGVLTLRRGQVVKQAHFAEGHPVRTASNVQGEGLLWVLVEEGLISSTEKLAIERELDQAGGRPETLLVERGLVAGPRLDSVRRRLSRRRLVDAFGWPDGEFRFEAKPVPAAAEGELLDGGELLVEAGARALPDSVCERFVRMYPGQFVFPASTIQRLADFYDRYFPPPNARSVLTRPLRFEDMINSGRVDRPARQAFALVVSGMASFRTADQIRAEFAARKQREAQRQRLSGQGAGPSSPPPPPNPPSAPPRDVRQAVRHPNPGPPSGAHAAVRHPNPPSRARSGGQGPIRHPNHGSRRSSAPPAHRPARPSAQPAPGRRPRTTGSQPAVGSPPAQRPTRPATGSQPAVGHPPAQRPSRTTGSQEAVQRRDSAGPRIPMRGQGKRRPPPSVPMRGAGQQASRSTTRPSPSQRPAPQRPSAERRVAPSARPQGRPSRPAPSRTTSSRPAASRAAARPTRADRTPPPMPPKIQQRLAKAKALFGKLQDANHYDVLGVPQDATPDQVRKAFRGLAREFHADVFARYALPDQDRQVVQKVFIAVNKASEVLSDAAKRGEYDLGLQHGVPAGATGAAGAGMQIDQVFKAEKLVRDAVLLIRNNSGPAAKQKLDEALGITPDDPLAQAAQAYAEYMVVQARGNAPQMAGRTREKLEAITANYEARDEPFVYLGRIYRALNQPERAEAAFKKALAINPRCAEAGSELRFLQRQLQDGKGGKSKGLFGRKKK